MVDSDFNVTEVNNCFSIYHTDTKRFIYLSIYQNMVYVSFLPPPWTNFIDQRESFCCVNDQVKTLMTINISEVFQHPKPEVNWLKRTRKSVWPSSAVTDQI